jgi:hypothetical protein
LGSAAITHPFHPLRGQRFPVLKIRLVSGVPCVSLRHADRGSFAVPQEWTDWGITEPPLSPSLVIDAFGLSDLAAIVDFLVSDSTRD